MQNEWLQTLHDGLRSEERHQRDEHDRLAALDLEGRMLAGLTWPPMRFARVERRGWRVSVDLRAPSGVVLHDGITPGDTVSVAPLGGGEGFHGRVDDVDGRLVTVRLDRDQVGRDGIPGWLEAVELDVTLLFDPSTFVRYRQALERADGAPSLLKDALLEPEASGELPEPIDLEGLNGAQRAAAAHALRTSPLALVHGPPGTGKTHLLARVLAQLVADGERPWALADSNAAVDHLALAAEKVGLRALRMGNHRRIGADARHLSLDEAIAKGPLAAAIKKLEREQDAFRELRELRQQARAHAIDGAQVLCCTFGSLAWLGQELPPARTAVVDEATQAIEPAVWTAVPHVQRLVLVGDPNQLGPVVMERGNPLERSLLVRLMDAGLDLVALDEQHRMHVAIQGCVEEVYGPSYHPADRVSGHLLRDLPGVAEREATSTPVLWVDTAGAGFDEERDPVTMSLRNAGEARVVAFAVDRLRKAGVRPDDIGVIAPYSAQVARLRAEPALGGIEVATVNAFQGREKEAIVCSFVRSNDGGELGFVADGRRLTVALTRARRALLIVGDSATLAGDRRFTALLDHLANTGALASVWEPPWSELLT
jgi:ATP-dependent RNA/DNA helicase IGHMBP2